MSSDRVGPTGARSSHLRCSDFLESQAVFHSLLGRAKEAEPEQSSSGATKAMDASVKLNGLH